jgi:hypothetical protein
LKPILARYDTEYRRLEIKNPVLCTRFFFVSGAGEISNFDFVKDLEEVVDYLASSLAVSYIYDT